WKARARPTENPLAHFAPLRFGRYFGDNDAVYSWPGADPQLMWQSERTGIEDMSADRAVGDIAGHVENGNWVESSGVEHDEFAPADKVLTGRAHAQLDGLRGRVAIDATDELFDLHQVERGMGGGL